MIDLNGFGQGTGDLRTSRWWLNPNLGVPGVHPPLALGSSALDAGGAGFLTFTVDVVGNSRLLAGWIVNADDIHIGQPLDLVYNGGRRNHWLVGNQVNPATFTAMPGNTISVAPHPNPPRLVLPSPVPEAGIDAEEPTVTTSGQIPDRVTTMSPPARPSPRNLLVPILGARYSGIFVGPPPPPPPAPVPVPYLPYTCRQQIGHFLYVVDRAAHCVHVVNSNRFTVLRTVPLPDPYSAALSPNLRWLAVSNRGRDTVSFLDVDPLSPTFHAVLAEIPVGRGPEGLAWQPEGEDLLVCNTLDHSVSILSATNFRVRKVLRNGIVAPRDVAVVARQVPIGMGLGTWTYFALICNGDGTLAGYESGPVPYGADDSVALALPVQGASVVKARLSGIAPEFFVAHRDTLGLAQVSVVDVTTSGSQRTWSVTQRYGGVRPPPTTPRHDLFSGNTIVDLAFDEAHNDGAAPDVPSLVPGLTYARHSGKGHWKQTAQGVQPAHRSVLLFAACSDAGRIDVFELTSGGRIVALPANDVRCLGHYWRQ